MDKLKEALGGISSKILIPAVILIIIYLIVCYRSIYKSKNVRNLPKWAWYIIVSISIPLGGVIYYIFGYEEKW